MNLHHVGKRPDWQLVPPEKWNIWQQLAARTAGLVTLANVVSLSGAALGAWGIIEVGLGRLAPGLVAIALGRLADSLDGLLADVTGTKSPLGELLDATLDKSLLFVVLGVFAVDNLAPLWVLAGVTGLALLAGLYSLIAKLRSQELHPSAAGKLSTAGTWVVLVGFGAAKLLHVAPLGTGAAMLAIVVLGAAILAIAEYAQVAFGRRTDRRQPSRPLPVFARIIIIKNPASSNAASAKKYIAALQKLLPGVPCQVICTTPDSHHDMGGLLLPLAGQLGPNTLLGIAGGDGTTNSVIEWLLTSGNLPPVARRTPILPLWAGNGNDLATMLNGPAGSLGQTLNVGRVVAIYPLACTLRFKRQGRSVRLAAYTASFGASANIARRLDEPARRTSWLNTVPGGQTIHNYTTGLLAWFEAKPFTVMEHGKVRPTYDRIFANGWRACTMNVAPVGLTERAFYFIHYPANHFAGALLHLFDTMNPWASTRTHPVRFTLHTPTWAQFDGEPVQLPARTRVTVKLNRQPFYAISTQFGQL